MLRFSRSTFTGLLVVLLFTGCREDSDLPTTPHNLVPSNQTTGSIWGLVVSDSGSCIPDAVVEIVAGPGTGTKVVNQAPCSVWDYGGGFTFSGLPLDEPIRLRATKKGYKPGKVETKAVRSGRAIEIVLQKR